MRKSTIVKTWLGGLIATALGLVAVGVAIFLMVVSGSTERQDAFFWAMIGTIVSGGVLAAAGGVVQFAAWIGALVNSFQLPDKTWFVLTLVLGLLGFGLIAMIAYVIGAPDGYEERLRMQVPISRPPSPVPTA